MRGLARVVKKSTMMFARRHWQQLTERDAATTVYTQAPDGSSLSTGVWTGSDGFQCHVFVLRTSSRESQRLVGIALLVAGEKQPLASDVQHVASVLSTRFVELGDTSGVAFD